MSKYEKKFVVGKLPFLLFACSILFVVSACGYAIHGKSSLPFRTIQIGVIENSTTEPRLQDMLYAALTEEFLKQGISVEQTAGYRLRGVIRQFDLRVLSETRDFANEYEIIMKSDFFLTDPDGKTKEFRRIGSPFIISFSSSGTVNRIIASKEDASRRAIRDMASQIVAGIIFR